MSVKAKTKTAPAKVASQKETYAASVNIDMIASKTALAERVRETVRAFEAWQSEVLGKKFVAVRTRQQLCRKGFAKTVEDTIEIRPSPGFRMMVEAGRPHFTYEWIALEFPKSFNGAVLNAARKRLDDFKVEGYPGWVKPKAKRAKASKPLELQPIPAGAQAILDEAKAQTIINEAKAQKKAKAEAKKPKGKVKAPAPAPEPAPEPEKKGRGWNLKGRKGKAKSLAETVHDLHPKPKAKARKTKELATAAPAE